MVLFRLRGAGDKRSVIARRDIFIADGWDRWEMWVLIVAVKYWMGLFLKGWYLGDLGDGLYCFCVWDSDAYETHILSENVW